MTEIAAFIADDAVWIDGPRGRYEGRAEIHSELAKQVGGASDVFVEITAIASSGMTVLTERIDHFSIAGQPLGLAVAGMFEIDGASRITSWRDYYDPKELNDLLATLALDSGIAAAETPPEVEP